MIFNYSLDWHRKWLDWNWKAAKIFILMIVPVVIIVISLTNVQSGDDPLEVATQAATMFGLSILFLGAFWLFRFFLHGVLDFIEVIGRKE
jgi:hypothetical protein